MFRISELRNKDVIDEKDGRRLGYAADVELDAENGVLKALVIPGESRLFGFWERSEELVIPWEKIKKIGADVVMVGEELPLPPAQTEKAAPEKGGSFPWEDWGS
ncbi:MAG: YlmC/YmxH family sporulation protein [Firmicutes bacterium]|nr:YlmC/YmxH family sporulation protein [Bacillota bacterium]